MQPGNIIIRLNEHQYNTGICEKSKCKYDGGFRLFKQNNMETEMKLLPVKIAEIQLVYKTNVKVSERAVIRTSKDGYEIAKLCWDSDAIELQEQFKVLFLNNANQVLGMYQLSTGSTVATVVDVRLLFASAIKANAVSIVLIHNHPSGNLLPSQADKDSTNKIVNAGRLLDVRVLDHLIITAESYYSFADEGLL
jgi:DNA repair protein RadC